MLTLMLDYLGPALIVAGILLMLAFWLLVRGGFRPSLRPLGGYALFEQQIGQAVESGGRVHISIGPNSIIGEETGAALAALAMLDLAARAAVISDLPPVATTGNATSLPVVSDTIRRAYERERMFERFHPSSARLVALDPTALAGGITSIIPDEEVRTNILFGSFGPEVALATEAGRRKRILQTLGSDRLEAQAVGYTMADHVLIGEEMFAARAYLSAEPTATAGLITQDVLRWLVTGLIVLGALLQSLGLLR